MLGITSATTVIVWILILVTYTLEAVFGTWAALIYVLQKDYVLFGLTVACLVPAMVVLAIISLVWYADQDKYYKGLQEAHPHDQQLKGYKRFLHLGSVLAHVALLGQLYR